MEMTTLSSFLYSALPLKSYSRSFPFLILDLFLFVTEDYNPQERRSRIKHGAMSRGGRWSGNTIHDKESSHGHHHHSERREREKNHLKPSKLNRKNKDKKIKFLQLTDVHLDLLYKQGSSINCGAPLCCRSDNLNSTSICSSSHPDCQESLKDARFRQSSHGKDKNSQWPGSESVDPKGRDHESVERSRAALHLMKSTQDTTREEQGKVLEEEKRAGDTSGGAGSWGELEGFCDSPLRTALSILEHINERFSRHIPEPNLPVNDASKSSSSHDHKKGRMNQGEKRRYGGRKRHERRMQEKVNDRTFVKRIGVNHHNRLNDNNSPKNEITSGLTYENGESITNNSQPDGSIDGDDDATVFGLRNRDHTDSNDTIDYILWTGDITPHDVWHSDMGDLIRVVTTWSDAMKTYLPKGIPVFPVLGNHDTTSVNQ